MSIDAGGLAQMTYNNNNNNAFPTSGLGPPTSGFGGRSRFNTKRLSVALPPKVNPINENQVDSPTPRTSRSHLLAGLRTQPRTPAVPASAPYNQTQHLPGHGLAASKWANTGYSSYDQGLPQTATGVSFDRTNHYATNAGRQTYALPEQVLAPPSLYDQAEEMDPAVLQQMQMTSLYLAQRQQQLQQQLASLTASAQGLNLNGTFQQHGVYQQASVISQAPQNLYIQHQQVPSPIEVQGQPGVYLVYNPATHGHTYVFDNTAHQQQVQPSFHQPQQAYPPGFEAPVPSVSVSPPIEGGPIPSHTRTFTPPKKSASPPSLLDHVEPLPPPSLNAFRRGHSAKKSASLSISVANAGAADGPKTASVATFGSQRSNNIPAGPNTGTFGPGAARAGEHPLRQPRGPPPLEELTALPTANHEGSKNFATRQRRRALDNLMKAGTNRRGVSRGSASSDASSPGGVSPVNSQGDDYPFDNDYAEFASASVGGLPKHASKMSPIGSERGSIRASAEKRCSHGSSSSGDVDGYFGGLSCSASSSEAEDAAYKQPPTPATLGTSVCVGATVGGERNMLMLAGVLNAAEKRKSTLFA